METERKNSLGGTLMYVLDMNEQSVRDKNFFFSALKLCSKWVSAFDIDRACD